MITNERQYRITRNKADRFVRAIDEFDVQARERRGIHPRLIQAELDGMMSLLSDLRDEIAEYEELQTADVSVISEDSLDGLAEGLIKARIAGRLTQRALADRLGLKEQQIQRYEAERYASASFKRMREIANALEVRIENEILLPVEPVNFNSLLVKVGQVGLSREFVVERLMSSADAAVLNGEVKFERHEERITSNTVTVLERVFGWTHENILGAQALAPTSTATAGFKAPKSRKDSAARLYATYAKHLARVTIDGMAPAAKNEIPTDPQEMRSRILERNGGHDDLQSVLHTVWDLGVIVLPLKGMGMFHGACWRYEGRNAIVLKQESKCEARWTFDLLHELYHAAQHPEQDTFEVVESDIASNERMASHAEIEASKYAGDVMLDSKADELAEQCAELANNSVPQLKSVVPSVAKSADVKVGALANYMAIRLSLQGLNWWEAAADLQQDHTDPGEITRDVFVNRHSFKIENEIDRSLLDRALY